MPARDAESISAIVVAGPLWEDIRNTFSRLETLSTSGKAFNIAEVAIGSHAGEYRNAGGDCSSLSPVTLSGAWNTGW